MESLKFYPVRKKLKSLNCNSDIKIQPKKGERISIQVTLTITTERIEKVSEKRVLIITNCLFEIVDFGQFQAEIETLAEANPIAPLIEYFEEKNAFPEPIHSNMVNSMYDFLMSIIIPLAEKMRLPNPLPPLVNPEECS
jgi:hypothetical protein